MSTLSDYYARYVNQGWSVIPIQHGSKKPLLSWKDAQTHRADHAQVQKWADLWPDSGIAVVTGEISQVFVIDVDSPEAAESEYVRTLPPTATVRTSKGLHRYYHPPSGVHIPTKNGFLPRIDCRGDFGYAILPPSIHESGVTYEWITDPQTNIVTLDDQHLRPITGTKLSDWGGGVAEGGRNDAAAKFVGALLTNMPETMWRTNAWDKVQAWNEGNLPPLPLEELERTFESIANKEFSKRQFFVPAKLDDDEDEEFTWATEMDIPEVQHYIEELRLEVGAGPGFFTGYSGAGKTALAMHLGASLLTGTHVFGKFPILNRPPYVVFVSIDMPSRDLHRRMQCLKGQRTEKFVYRDWSLKDFNPNKFEKLLAKYQNSFVIVDCYADILMGTTSRTNDPQGLSDRSLIKQLRRVYETFKCDGYILDHEKRPSTKPSTIIGASENYIGAASKRAAIRHGINAKLLLKSLPSNAIMDDEGVPYDHVKIDTLKPGDSGSFEAFTVAMVREDVFRAGKHIGASVTPQFIEPTNGEKAWKKLVSRTSQIHSWVKQHYPEGVTFSVVVVEAMKFASKPTISKTLKNTELFDYDPTTKTYKPI